MQIWLIWLIMVAAIEAPTLARKDPIVSFKTHFARWANLKDKSWGWIARRCAWVIFFIWLIYHSLV